MRWEFHNDAPIYAQLVERIQRMIVSGVLQPGQRLPSVRAFAEEAGVNPNTMQKALTELERSGLIYSQRTAGHFVTQEEAVIAAVREGLAAAQIRRFLQTMTELGYGPAEVEAALHRQVEPERRAEQDANSEL